MGQLIGKILHVDVAVLQVLVKRLDFIEHLKVVNGVEEVLMRHKL